MKTVATTLDGVLIVESPVFKDDRGLFVEVHHADKLAAVGFHEVFVQDNHSRSSRNVLRGLHFQRESPQGKLVRVVTGRIFDVAVDLRQSSPTFGQWFGTVLSETDGKQLWIPPKFAHGFLVLSNEADVSYKCTTPYHHSSDSVLAWNDPALAIQWPFATADDVPLLSAKDAAAPHLSHVQAFE